MTLKPRQTVPDLQLATLDGERWRLAEAAPRRFTMLVVYRGLHCPVCQTYLGQVQSKLPEFEERGVEVLALSSDSRQRAETAQAEWGLKALRIGYELPIAVARAWGLFISRSIREAEPPEFTEPGLFLIKPDRTLFFSAIQTAPWGRPPMDQMLRGIDIAVERNMPARGEA
ncbi:MAG TPA: peroxiredoxin-like family protein [Alphaproteobacteria bacterium]